MAPTLKLKDGTEEVNFLDGTNYKLEDATFMMSAPERVETRVQDNFFAGRDLLRMEYGPRSVTFNIYVYGSTQLTVSNNISAIQRLLSRASSLTYLQGGAYSQDVEMVEGKDTGDQGVILQLRRGDDNLGNITSEYSNTSIAMQGLYTMRVISGDLEVNDRIFSSADKNASGKYYRNCTITLQTEPFILGPSRVIRTVASPGFAPNGVNRTFFNAADVPGDVEALTRIGTELDGATGLVIARDAGISILNCPSYPTLSSGKDDVFVYGQVKNATNQALRININGVGSPNTFRFSSNGGGAWGPTTNIVPWTEIPLIPSGGTPIGAYAVFGSATGFLNGQTWSFNNHQSNFYNAGANINVYTQRNNLMNEAGYGIYSTYINVPPGCRGRYKVSAYIQSDTWSEFRMRVYYIGRGESGGNINRIASEPQNYEWTGPYNTRTVDLGIIDLTSASNPFLSHPYTGTVLQIIIYARTAENLVNPSDTRVIKMHRMFLIPCQDEFSYMQAGWKVDGTGREVYSNYDASNPYIAEESINMLSGQYNGRVLLGLDATYGGNIITMIPNVDQTLYFIPSLASQSDWRASIIGSGTTGGTYIAIRPRYLHLPA